MCMCGQNDYDPFFCKRGTEVTDRYSHYKRHTQIMQQNSNTEVQRESNSERTNGQVFVVETRFSQLSSFHIISRSYREKDPPVPFMRLCQISKFETKRFLQYEPIYMSSHKISHLRERSKRPRVSFTNSEFVKFISFSLRFLV